MQTTSPSHAHYKSAPCEICECLRRWRLYRYPFSNGIVNYGWICETCRNEESRGRYITNDACRAMMSPEQQAGLPIAPGFHAVPPAICAHCNKVGGWEEHHWAPYSAFGEEAGYWPTSPLCPKCHKHWWATICSYFACECCAVLTPEQTEAARAREWERKHGRTIGPGRH